MTIDIIELDQQSRHLVPDHVNFGDVRLAHSDQHISPSTYILFLRSSNLHPIAPNPFHYLIENLTWHRNPRQTAPRRRVPSRDAARGWLVRLSLRVWGRR